jgi:putative hemolysin
MEDVLAEIVGELQRMSEAGRFPIHRLGPGQFSLEGMLPVREFNRYFPVPLPPEETYTTLAGFLMDKLGRVPELHQELEWADYRFSIQEIAGRQIRRVRLTVLDRSTGTAPAAPEL